MILKRGLFLHQLGLETAGCTPKSTCPFFIVLARYRLLGQRPHFLHSFVNWCGHVTKFPPREREWRNINFCLTCSKPWNGSNPIMTTQVRRMVKDKMEGSESLSGKLSHQPGHCILGSLCYGSLAFALICQVLTNLY